MGFLNKKSDKTEAGEQPRPTLEQITHTHSVSDADEQHVTVLAVASGLTASLGGLVFGYCR